MTEFLWGLAGAGVGAVVTGLVLGGVIGAVVGPFVTAPTRGDRVAAFVLGVAATAVLMGSFSALVPGSAFAEKLGLGIGLTIMFGTEDLFAMLRGHVRSGAPAAALPTRVDPARFTDEVREHFADPTARARYVVAAYRRGLIAPGFVPALAAELAPSLVDRAAWSDLAAWQGQDGLEATVDRAALALDYAPNDEVARADTVERLVYAALCGDDPRTRLATAEALALPMSESASPRLEARRARAVELRVLLADSLAARYGPALPEAVQRRFTGAPARARALVAEYRHGLLVSPQVPQAAAEIVAELPGEAWTELAMAAPDAPRSELLPVLDRAATEIAYAPTERDAEIDVLEAAAYRAVVDGRVVRESSLLRRIDFHGDRDDYPPELQLLRDAWFLSDGGEEQLASVRSRLVDYLTARYG
ncbi:hypothetical protein AXK56_10370 [Tsukamurella pulmonis]|uniref:Uncharacterized protein n=1 Tax=Tsukamurella pulmonis TaxID=47312 RepID=A0A1H1FDK6_9ACTN|nr:DUF456 domain-containing protein [Tsukamurella pulmonis]KXO88716.1 hypothetical protein AXK56_10370 [Tsukamurella pulmonis]SDQ98556.1 hypothetical protein SAMN04489765_2636 [Tsukamurella pulmonis]SUP19705.1 Uncharacterised protein [Tsukamurella pulmonis]